MESGMSKHVGYPGDRLVLNIEVMAVVEEQTDFGPVYHYTLKTDAGDILFWKASRDTKKVPVGTTYRVKASIRNHDTDEAGVKRTIVSHVLEYKAPPRIPRIAVGFRHR